MLSPKRLYAVNPSLIRAIVEGYTMPLHRILVGMTVLLILLKLSKWCCAHKHNTNVANQSVLFIDFVQDTVVAANMRA